jgi:L-glyceraldehyde 3-phosphate reductase
VSSLRQLEDNVASLQRLDFAPEELAEIDQYAQEGRINIWAESSQR